jgi:hypothetical protein
LLSLQKSFTDTDHWHQFFCQRCLNLGCNFSIRLTKQRAPLRMANEHVPNTAVLQHTGGYFPSISTMIKTAEILRAENDIRSLQ